MSTTPSVPPEPPFLAPAHATRDELRNEPELTAVNTPAHEANNLPNRLASTALPSHIKSFVNRRGTITQGQKSGFTKHADKWVLPYQAQMLDPALAFGRIAPTILEIGFGMGETTAAIAVARPSDNFLGVEVFEAGVGSLLNRLHSQSIDNVRIIQHDAVEVLRDMIAPNSLAGVHIYFPDPWHKKRHHKRRLIQAALVSLLASRIQPGGYLHCATDWEHYAHQMLAVLSTEPSLVNTCEGFAPRPEYRPLTKFEARGLRLGHGVFDLIFKRK